MTIVEVIVIVALVLGIIGLLDSRGRDKNAWAIVLICIALLWGPVTGLFE